MDRGESQLAYCVRRGMSLLRETTTCRYCGGLISISETQCPHCDMSTGALRISISAVVRFVVICLLLLVLALSGIVLAWLM